MKIELVERGLCRIMAETNDELEPIRNFFKTENDNKFFVQHHNPQYSAPDFKYGISALGVFKIGLIMSVLKVMKSLDIKPEVDKKIFENLFPIKHLNIRPLVFELPCESNEDFENRDYQHEAVEKNLKRGRGVTVMATGSGKSFVIAKTLYSLLKTEPEKIKHCLILVPTTNLVIQFYKDLLSYGLTEDELITGVFEGLMLHKNPAITGGTFIKEDSGNLVPAEYMKNGHKEFIKQFDWIGASTETEDRENFNEFFFSVPFGEYEVYVNGNLKGTINVPIEVSGVFNTDVWTHTSPWQGSDYNIENYIKVENKSDGMFELTDVKTILTDETPASPRRVYFASGQDNNKGTTIYLKTEHESDLIDES